MVDRDRPVRCSTFLRLRIEGFFLFLFAIIAPYKLGLEVIGLYGIFTAWVLTFEGEYFLLKNAGFLLSILFN